MDRPSWWHEFCAALAGQWPIRRDKARGVEMEAEIERLRAELAAAESTIAALEDPELRAALSKPTTGDFGPVPHPNAAAETERLRALVAQLPAGSLELRDAQFDNDGPIDHIDAVFAARADEVEVQLYERAEDAAAARLPLDLALQAVRNGYSSIEADRAVTEDP